MPSLALQAAPAPAAETITLALKYTDGSRTMVRVSLDTRMEKVFGVFCRLVRSLRALLFPLLAEFGLSQQAGNYGCLQCVAEGGK